MSRCVHKAAGVSAGIQNTRETLLDGLRENLAVGAVDELPETETPMAPRVAPWGHKQGQARPHRQALADRRFH
ncbi:hypothetical protein [Azomonas macrocytogenes]|uniref:Uncharacterized protein n=1 Tax=Azomonas macrocytogenes TaxID=69962 RepID=A0A839T496_AZOMA|nr:hypothetical protein [Azomonas macrocytogenes]MBB3103154.1 hypothetical protein [Azomonas macrocytogenes]